MNKNRERLLKLVYDYCLKDEENEVIDNVLKELDNKDKQIEEAKQQIDEILQGKLIPAIYLKQLELKDKRIQELVRENRVEEIV